MLSQMKNEIDEKINTTYKGFLKSFKEDQIRVTRAELRIKKVEELQPKIKIMDDTLLQLQMMKPELEGVKQFIERQLPMLTHL